MLGALEVKAITRLAARHGRDWKPIHTAVMGCLLAHRNRRSGHCWPRRKDIAAHCNVSQRTIDRAMARLTAWGAIERQQPKAVSSGTFRPSQCTFLFELPLSELPQSVEKPCGLEEKNCENPPKPCAKNEGSRAPKTGVAVRHPGVARNKEVRERSEGKDLKGKGAEPPARELSNYPISQYSKRDFDERDLRKMAEAWKYLGKRNAEGTSRGYGMTARQMFEVVCELAGITIERGLELEVLRKKWPDDIPDWLKETG